MGESRSEENRRLRLIEGRSPRSQARRAWMTSRRRQGTITVLVYVTGGLYGMVAEVSSPWIAAGVPAGGYVVATSILSAMGHRWVNKYAALAESRRVLDLTPERSQRSRR